MIHVGFTRPVTIGTGRAAVTVHHEVVPMPARNAADLARQHPGAVVDLTPKAMGFVVSAPAPVTPLRMAPCPTCGGARLMLVCRTCNGRGRVMEIR